MAKKHFKVKIEEIIEQVKYNCNISDAKFWGYYSMCGMLMRLRELYRHENSLLPWQPIPNKDILEWIPTREALWSQLEDKELRSVKINDITYDSLDVIRINKLLRKYGVVYGGGYGMFHKPTFFVAKIKSERSFNGFQIFSTEGEMCRDLSAYPAMVQGKTILIRHAPLITLLYERFLDLCCKKNNDAINTAFAHYGIKKMGSIREDFYDRFKALSTDVAEILTMHEIGEIVEDDHSDIWLEILNNCDNKTDELYIRCIKDLLADTSDMGPLKFIVNDQNKILLTFFIALLDGFRKELFPEIMNAFQECISNNKWSSVEMARLDGYNRAKKIKKDIIKSWERGEKIKNIKMLNKQGLEAI